MNFAPPVLMADRPSGDNGARNHGAGLIPGSAGRGPVAIPNKGSDVETEYRDFLATKQPRTIAGGIEPQPLPTHLFDFQADVVKFAIRQGRAALFLDTGLGKTACMLEWSEQVRGDGMALILTPLAVARQIEREGLRWGYDCRVIRDQSGARPGINICNYDRLDKLDASAYESVALDESSILKSLNGAMRRDLTASFAGTRFRLCCTATPAPNDHTELGNHAEFLGVMNSQEMLARWFINDTATASQNWRLKGHAKESFWDWVATWARCAETPADLGYDASRYILPPMQIARHKAIGEAKAAVGMLFAMDVSATNMHAIKRETADARADVVAQLVASDPAEPWLIWCDTDYEADALCRRLTGHIDVRGSMSPERKEAGLDAFVTEPNRILVTKSGIAGMGLNFQHCARMAFVGRSFSYEAWYQAVRRCHRFGQTRPVQVHLIVAEGEDQIGRVIDAKSSGHSDMKRAMAASMKRATTVVNVRKELYNPTCKGRIPAWLMKNGERFMPDTMKSAATEICAEPSRDMQLSPADL